MRFRWIVAMLGASAAVVSVLAVADERAASPGAKRFLSHLPRDPLFAIALDEHTLAETMDGFVGLLSRFGEGTDPEQVRAKLHEVDQKLGCSLHDDLLARVGPDLAVVADLPPVDLLAASIQDPEKGIAFALGGIGVLATVRDFPSFDGCLRKTLALGDAEISGEDGLVRVRFPFRPPLPGDSPTPSPPSKTALRHLDVYYGFRDGAFALGSRPPS